MISQKRLMRYATPQSGKLAVVTGANSGIGFACARYLLTLGARVLLACRNPKCAQDALARLRAEFPHAQVDFLLLDLADQDLIDSFVADLRQRGETVDILIHCAGVYYPKESLTKQGLPMTLGVNYAGAVRLGEAMLPLMQADGRMVFTTSLVDRFGKPTLPQKAKKREGYAEYAQSKLLLSSYVCRRAATRTQGEPAFLAAHPGITATSLLDPAKTTHTPLFSRLGHAFLFLFTHKKEKAALSVILAACGEAENGDCIGPRGPFGISGYPHKTRFCRRVRKQARL